MNEDGTEPTTEVNQSTQSTQPEPTVFEDTAPSTSPDAQSTGTSAAPTAPQAQSAWTPEHVQELITKAAEAGASRVAGQPAPAPEKVYTPEEIAKLTNAYTASPELVENILAGGEAGLAAVNELLEGVVKHATTVAWLQSQLLAKQTEERFSPALTGYQREQTKRLEKEFFGQYPTLAGKESLLKAVRLSLMEENAFEGKTQEQAFKLLADRAQEFLGATGAVKQPVEATPQMASLSRGSQHGAAAPSGAGGAAPSMAETIFGD